MVRFQVAVGDATARITTRAKHPVLFHSPADRGAELKASFPDLGWIEDIEGHPTLPFSIAARLLLPYGADSNTRDTPLFTEFPGDKLFARFWASLAPKVNMAADNIFAELDRVFKSLDDTSTFLFTSGDWVQVEGDMGDGWDGLYRWVDCITRGDVFRLTPTHSSGLSAAELLYYVGRTCSRTSGTRTSATSPSPPRRWANAFRVTQTKSSAMGRSSRLKLRMGSLTLNGLCYSCT